MRVVDEVWDEILSDRSFGGGIGQRRDAMDAIGNFVVMRNDEG